MLENHMVTQPDDRSEYTRAEIDDVISSMDYELKNKGMMSSVAIQCWDYIEDCGINDASNDGLFVLALSDPDEAGRELAKIAESHLFQFCEENMDKLQEYFCLGKYAEPDEE